MKLRRSFLLIISLLFISNCTFFLKLTETNKEKLLFENLKFWDNIRIDGIIEANYKSFVFRKNIALKKNNYALRMDIYDSGIFGMQPAPFISAYYDSVLTIRTPDQQIDQLNPENNERIDLSILFQLSDLFTIKDEIIKYQKVIINGVVIIFSDDMRISEIHDNKTSAKIIFHYQQNLDSITFQKEKKEIINIQIDKITHLKEEINKL
ncbi:MAG: hypothetical protein P9L97_04285 [Candidatus Tenebribacter davisii]|nr:hypothetical protein [Candidatus Tenebribacter davisii]